MYYETKLKYEKTQENGLTKKVTETYVVRAVTNAEAEAITIEQMAPFCKGEMQVIASKQVKYAEFFGKDSEKYYLAKVAFITLDEQSGNEKRSINQMLVNADNFDEACKALKEGMQGTISDREVLSISETAILDVFTATPKPENEDEPNQTK